VKKLSSEVAAVLPAVLPPQKHAASTRRQPVCQLSKLQQRNPTFIFIHFSLIKPNLPLFYFASVAARIYIYKETTCTKMVWFSRCGVVDPDPLVSRSAPGSESNQNPDPEPHPQPGPDPDPD
jgi:hypothetical protein